MGTHRYSFFDPVYKVERCPLYQYIVDGIKTVEGRKNTNQNIKIGDTLLLDNRKKGVLVCSVTYVHKYPDVRSYLEGEGLDKTVPCINNIDDGVKIYEQFVPKDEINKLKNK